jgi:hypothetical protein
VPSQWEMYDLKHDPLEMVNLCWGGYVRSAKQEAAFRRLRRKARHHPQNPPDAAADDGGVGAGGGPRGLRRAPDGIRSGGASAGAPPLVRGSRDACYRSPTTSEMSAIVDAKATRFLGLRPGSGRLRRGGPNKHHIVKTFTIQTPLSA